MSAPAQAQERQPDSRWSLGRRVAFRFVCCYFLLYMAPDPPGRLDLIDTIPGGSFIANAYGGLWHKLVPWVAIHIFHLSGKVTTYFVTGSGDTTKDYIENLLFVVIAATAAVVWSVLDRKRSNYRTIDAWLRLAVRYTLAFTMFTYGFAKVFPLQFRFPGFQKLTEMYGDFSPMGVLWNFMGASTAYTIFGGICETLGGALLLFRRTATLGALVSFGVLLNVAMLNFCYDVPVKLYSVNLLLMAVFLAAPHCRRLLNLLVLNRAAEPADLTAPQVRRRFLRIGAVVFQVLFVGYFLYSEISGGRSAYKESYITQKRPPLYGLYDVETFTRNGQEILPLTTEATRWKRVSIQYPTSFAIRLMDDSPKGYTAAYNEAQHTVVLSTGAEKSDKSTLEYSQPDADHVVLAGKLGAGTLSMRLRKVDPNKFLLVNRGFHWINELPFNK
jgi:uncharacterized membrane protein YphA (DoxX/SURF4 family)